MKYHDIGTLRQAADVRPAAPAMSRRERLERWAELLDAVAPRRLPSLYEVESLPWAQRAAARANGSALSVAFADPVLREAGLRSDQFGDAATFFELSERDLHRLLCFCLNGRSIAADQLAANVRRMARTTSHTTAGMQWMPGAMIAGALATPFLLYLFG